jgi:hypothetical protein
MARMRAEIECSDGGYIASNVDVAWEVPMEGYMPLRKS